MAQQMICISARQHLIERQYRFHYIIHKPATTFQQSRHFFSRFLRRGKREKSIKGTAGRTVPPPRKGRQTSRPNRTQSSLVNGQSREERRKERQQGPKTKKIKGKREKKETGQDGREVGGRGTSMSTVTANTQDDVSYFCDFRVDFFCCLTFTDQTDID